MTPARLVHGLPQDIPSDGKFCLTRQMRRAAVSIPSSLAEGQARRGPREFVQFIAQAEGSLADAGTQLTLGIDFGCVDRARAEEAAALIEEPRRMPNALRRHRETLHR